MKKRILSLLVAAVLVISLLPVAAFAAGDKATFTVRADKAEVSQDEDITFTVYGKSTVNLVALQMYIADLPEGLTYKTSAAVDGLKDTLGSDGAADWTENIRQLAVGSSTPLKMNNEVALFTFTATAVKGGNYTVTITLGDDGAITEVNSDEDLVELTTDEFTVVPATVKVNKTKITPESLTLSYADTLAIADKNFKGTAAATISGKDDDGDDLPASELAKVTYEVNKAWAAVAADGTVSIKDIAAAKAEDITVTAKLGSVTTTATVAVTKAAAAVETVTVNGPTAAIIKANADQTYTFTATVEDQYGAAMTGQTIAWSTVPGTLPEGVSFAEGVLSVSKDTPAASKGDVKIVATVSGKSGEFTTKVTDIEFPGLADAVKVAATATYGDKWSKIVTIPATFAGKVGDATVNGTLTLKYEGAEIPAAAEEGPAFQVIFNAEGFENVVAFEGQAPAIAKKALTVKADDVRVQVNSALDTTKLTYKVEGLVGDDALTGTAAYELYAKAEDGTETKVEAEDIDTKTTATYTIKVTGLSAPSDNYTLTVADGTLTIYKRSSGGLRGESNDRTEKDPAKDPEKDPEKDPTTDTSKLRFDDVKENDWFFDVVNYVAENELMTGTAERIFEPNTKTSRAMIATILWRHAGSPEPMARIADFPDVDPDAWYIKAVRWCAEKEIITGYENGNFAPNENITREQLAAMFYRYAGSPEVDAAMGMAGFVDVDSVSAWAADAMRWAVQSGIINGKDGSKLDPQGLASRAETAAVLQRYLAKK